MTDIPNKTLATLLVVAIAVSLVGTFMSLNKVDTLLAVTGMQTTDLDYGDVNVTISAAAGIAVRHDINFGTGSVEGDNDTISSQVDNTPSSGWDIDCTSVAACRGMDVENIGNVNVNLSARFQKAAAAFIGGTVFGGPKFKILSVDGDQATANDGCTTGAVIGSWTEVAAATNYTICSNLSDGTGTNFVTLEVNITIPGDATNATKTNIVTMQGTELL